MGNFYREINSKMGQCFQRKIKKEMVEVPELPNDDDNDDKYELEVFNKSRRHTYASAMLNPHRQTPLHDKTVYQQWERNSLRVFPASLKPEPGVRYKIKLWSHRRGNAAVLDIQNHDILVPGYLLLCCQSHISAEEYKAYVKFVEMELDKCFGFMHVNLWQEIKPFIFNQLS